MNQILVVIDMQKDFIDGALGSHEAISIVPNVLAKVKQFEGRIFFTRDTHHADYPCTLEGKKLPVEHCIEGSDGWQIWDELNAYAVKHTIIDKPAFGSKELVLSISSLHEKEPVDGITLVGLCTDICIISNALLLKAFLPEVPLYVDTLCCAGVTPESHKNALSAMAACQVEIL